MKKLSERQNPMDDINSILATKRAWRYSERRKADRRIHLGNIKHRKTPQKPYSPNKDFIALALLIIAILILILIIPIVAHAYTKEDVIKSVIGEAEGESQESKEAIACSIHYRRTLQGVHGLYAYRIKHHLYSKNTYNNASRAVEIADDQEYCKGLINGAQYWGSILIDQKWIHRMELSGYIKTAIIGNTAFFRKN